MRDSFGFIGLTFSELGFLLLALGMLIMLLRGADRDKNITELEAELASTNQQLQNTEAARMALAVENEELKGELEELQGADRVPTCTEAGVFEGFLAKIVILGRERYRVLGDMEMVSEELFANRFSVPIQQGEEHDCTHRVELFSGQNVEATDYIHARSEVARFFYIADREGEP